MSSTPDPSAPSPWHELEAEAGAQLSALAVMVASGHGLWPPGEDARRADEESARRQREAEAQALELQRRMAALQAGQADDPA
ncbi:hypothetical protein GT347_07000 [Xylophilus rhododendri]|uniref:Uncharacterized protein n=1 Tax=Xylophilus rhododendri TaxID=2697032 RepID=A0A857J3P5_9BURK|nr:hypothetical protein [Xylophilus rhododendri]QHI97759.1 hypothetical protein GT347_07000 [Xylophilus rhododendri]